MDHLNILEVFLKAFQKDQVLIYEIYDNFFIFFYILFKKLKKKI